MDASQVCHVHIGSSLLRGGVIQSVCVCVCVRACVRGMWIVRTRTHWHMYTYADLPTPTHFLYGDMINRGIFGSSRAGSEKSFQLQTHFFFLFLNWFTRLIPVYRFFTTAVWASSSHHLIFSEVTRKSQPSCGFYNTFNISWNGVAHWVIRWSHQPFSLLHTSAASSLCFRWQGLNNRDEWRDSSLDRLKTLRCPSA